MIWTSSPVPINPVLKPLLLVNFWREHLSAVHNNWNQSKVFPQRTFSFIHNMPMAFLGDDLLYSTEVWTWLIGELDFEHHWRKVGWKIGGGNLYSFPLPNDNLWKVCGEGLEHRGLIEIYAYACDMQERPMPVIYLNYDFQSVLYQADGLVTKHRFIWIELKQIV